MDVVKSWVGGGSKGLNFWCPGCGELHSITTEPSGWQWNGDTVNPTFSPSVLVTGFVRLTDAEADKVLAGQKVERKPLVCHSFVKDGVMQFLSDCTHDLAGKFERLPVISTWRYE